MGRQGYRVCPQCKNEQHVRYNQGVCDCGYAFPKKGKVAAKKRVAKTTVTRAVVQGPISIPDPHTFTVLTEPPAGYAALHLSHASPCKVGRKKLRLIATHLPEWLSQEKDSRTIPYDLPNLHIVNHT